MSKFYGTTGLDLFFGPNAVNDYYFEFGELEDTDVVVGGTASDRLNFIAHPLGGQIIFADAFTNVSNVEFIYLPDTSDLIELTNALAVGAVPVGNSPNDLYVRGADGNDTLDASRVTSSVPLLLEGEEGNDTITGGGDESSYTGGRGDDEITLSAGVRTVDAGDDEDLIFADASEIDGDSIDGGDQVDDLILTSAGAFELSMIGIESVLLVSGVNDGEITSKAHDGGDEISVHVEGGSFADTVKVVPGSSGLIGWTFENYLIESNGGNDVVTGGSGNDTLDGGANTDALSGGGGDDRLIGGSGSDILTGGGGNDRYVGVESGDIVNEVLSTGTDTIETARTTYVMPVNIEILDYTGTAAVTFTGNTKSNLIEASANNNDLIRGGDGNDTVNALGGADTLHGEGGGDTLDGYVGDDLLKGAAGTDSLSGGSGYDAIHGGSENDSLFGGSEDDTLTAGAGDDVLQGDDGADILRGDSGFDTAIYGAAGAGIDADLERISDQVVSGAWIDQLSSIEHIEGSNHKDTIRGDDIGNNLVGGGGRDVLEGRRGADTLDGGAQADRLMPGSGNDEIVGGTGFDTVDYRLVTANLEATYSLTGGFAFGLDAGTDHLASVENIIGGAGNDTMFSWPEAHGGAGDDTFEATNDVNRFFGDEGIDTVVYDDGPSTIDLYIDLEDATLNQNAAAGDTLESIENITYVGIESAILFGDGSDNRIQSSGTLNSLFGRAGDDTLAPLADLDILDGGEGIDELDYGLSTAAVTLTQIGVVIQGDGGVARGDGAVNVESLRGSGFNDVITVLDTDFSLHGGDGADSLTAGSGADTLDGGLGADTMTGGSADDTYYVDDAGDVVTEFVDGGFDYVNTTLSVYTLPSGVNQVNYIGTGDFFVTGNSLRNTFTSLDGDDRFVDVFGGPDFFSAGGGTDTVDYRTSATGVVLNFATNVQGGAAQGDSFSSIEKFTGSETAADTMTAGGTVRAVFFGYGGNDVLTGATDDDVLAGGAGNDALSGGAEIDSINGELGNDTLTGGTDGDIFIFADAAFGQDTITDFADGFDVLKVSSAVANDFGDFTITGNGTASVRLTLAAEPANMITVNASSAITISAADFTFY